MADNQEAVRSSFSRQVGLFSGESSPFAGRGANLAWLEPIDAETVALEIACGAAHVAQDLAPHVRAIVGIDLTPELLTLGRDRLRDAGIDNVVLQEGDAQALPFVDDSFDLVYCRASLHHFADPARAVGEMVRVCRPGGQVTISDLVVPDPELRDAFDGTHRLLDPSHMCALTADELVATFPPTVGLAPPEQRASRMPLEAIVSELADRERLDARLQEEMDGGAPTGLVPGREDDAVIVEFATCVIHATKAG
ncbi:MAG TPA: methyltransferase domain-containing protein [Gaiellaceae bacterium]|nr:methyltransferase domain-containing protein [Gaiellaceae bacterium]